MYQLEETFYFYLLASIPILLVAFLWLQWWKKRAQNQFASAEALKILAPAKSKSKPVLKLLMVCLAIALWVIALVNPRIGTTTEQVKREGIDIVFALDVSKSMLAEDIAPNRLEKSKQLVSQLLNQLAGDRVGVVGYAGSAFPQVPITTDYAAVRMFLNAMNTDMVSSQGTAIAEAITMATSFFREEDQTNKVIVIISDGEDHQGNIEAAVAAVQEKGIKIITVGVGTPAGAPIPIKRNGVLDYYQRDQNGERVITRMDDTILTAMAEQTGGIYIAGQVTSQVVENIQEYINTLDKTEFESVQYADFKSYFQWFLAGSLLFLFLDIFLLERKTKWIERLDLFNEKKSE